MLSISNITIAFQWHILVSWEVGIWFPVLIFIQTLLIKQFLYHRADQFDK